MINNLINENKWIIIAFAPGSYGYKLGKWLANNQIVFVDHNMFVMTHYANDLLKTNHSYLGCFSDVLLSSGQQEDIIKKELVGHFPDFNLIKKILADSTTIPNKKHNNKHLILTHYSQYRVLYELSKMFNNSKVIRIIFESHEQAIDAINRKRSLDNQKFDLNNDWGDLCDNYFPFLNEFKFSIDIPVNKVEKLELDFLKELI